MQPGRRSLGGILTDGQPGAPRPRGIRAYAMLTLAILACPCHLPLLIVLLAGTATGAALQENFTLAAGALTVIFIVTLFLGLRWSERRLKEGG